jgi:hypothetical protein
MRKIIFILSIIITTWSSDIFGQDRIFNYVYQSLVLNKGQKELEVWMTYLTGKSDYYRSVDSRVEFEIGLSKRLQTTFYLNYSSKVQGQMTDTLAVLEKESEFSLSNEWKFKMSDPVANVFGSALYGEFTISPDEFEIEVKVILDKKMGRVTQALNLVFEPEWKWQARKNKIEEKTEYKFEINYGLGVSLGKGWSLGTEIRNVNLIENDAWANSALYAGPVVSYSRNDFWINFTILPQVAGLRGITPGYSLNLEEYEKIQARLLFSIAL